jgi:hypothetical protein
MVYPRAHERYARIYDDFADPNQMEAADPCTIEILVNGLEESQSSGVKSSACGSYVSSQ